jgi:hypothetical protein
MNTDDLRLVLDHPGPFATVHLDGSHDTESADHELHLRWRAAREELATEGVREDTLAALDETVRTAHPNVGKAGRLLVAAGAEVLVDRRLPSPPPMPEVRFGPLPYLLPLLDQEAPDELLARFREALGADRGFAVQGLADTTDALRQHNAEAVVLSDLADATLWFSREFQSIAVTEEELRVMGAVDPVPARADEVLPDYGLRVDATVISTPGESLIDGVGVLCLHK